MARRPVRIRRSAGEWGVRGLLAVVVVAWGYVGVAQSLASELRVRDAARAQAMAPWDGRLSAALAQALSVPNATPAIRRQANGLARRALRQDPTTVVAASTLGINTEIGGNARGARRLIDYAQMLSRRDLASQIWSIVNALTRGDVSGALRHFDIALRTTTRASNLLFPILAAATADPDIRPALVRTLAKRPSWSGLFVEYAAASGPDPRATSLLLRELDRTGYPISGLSRALLTDTLASRGLFDDAWSFYASFRRGADRRSTRDPGFTAELSDPTVFDWRPVTDSGISASLQRGMLDFAAPASVGGAMVEQVQLLPPGGYRIAGHSIGIEQPQGASPYWQLRCRDGREIGRVDVPNSTLANGNFVGRFVVPAGCPVQSLTLVAKPSDAVAGVTGQIDHVQLAPWR